MNELIEKLWVESTQTVVPRDGKWSSVDARAIQKFAESLIKEGAAKLAKSDRYRGQAFAEDLMMHFGIAPARHDWVIRKVEGTKDKFYVEHGEPPLHVMRTYGIID